MKFEQLRRLKEFVLQAHKGQVDKAGRPYYEHVFRVADKVPDRLVPVALCHDLLEDTSVLPEELREYGLTEREIELVVLLTRFSDVTYMEYIRRIGEDEDAKIVKMADLRDNMDSTRWPELTDEAFGLLKRYHKAHLYLMKLE